MVLELKIPHGTGWDVVKELAPKLYCYVLSFAFIAIYWGNHHHLMHTVKKVNAAVIWSNTHLLFWLSLVPFATGWMGENNFDRITVATYGALLIICGLTLQLLSRAIRKSHNEQAGLARAIGSAKVKSWVSVALYSLSVPVALFLSPYVSEIFFAIVAIMWIIPSKEIERALSEDEN
jgi:uncharacterized membrane protein